MCDLVKERADEKFSFGEFYCFSHFLSVSNFKKALKQTSLMCLV